MHVVCTLPYGCGIRDGETQCRTSGERLAWPTQRASMPCASIRLPLRLRLPFSGPPQDMSALQYIANQQPCDTQVVGEPFGPGQPVARAG